MLRVVIPEAIPSRNKGELAILEGIREALNHYGPYELTLYSSPSLIDDDTRNSNGHYQVVGGVDLFDRDNGMAGPPVPLTRKKVLRVWGKIWTFSFLYRLFKRLSKWCFKDPLLKAIANADLIIAGHDGTLSMYHFYLCVATRIMNKPLVIYGGSHGLQGKQKLRIRKYFQYLINHSILCTVRDPRAKEIFVLNGVNAEKIHVFPDPAVLLEPCEDARVLEILMDEKIPKTKGTPLFGLIPVQGGKSGRCLRECFLSTGGSPEATYQRRVQLWVEIIEHLLKVTNAHFVFIPHCIGPSVDNDDRRMSRAIYETIPGDRHRLTFIETEYSPDELKGLMKHCDYVLGERAHGLIGAVTVGTPCMALTTKSDLRMFNIIQKMFGRIVFDLTDPDVDELKELLTDEWNRRAETALKMREKANEIRKEGIHAAELLSQRIHEACDIKIFDRSSVVTRR